MRLGEVVHIAPNDVSLPYLRKTKTNYPRSVPLTQRAKKVLETFQPYWGKERGFQVTSNTASSTWLTFKTELLEKGFFKMKNRYKEPLLTVAHIHLITGHKDVNTLDLLQKSGESLLTQV